MVYGVTTNYDNRIPSTAGNGTPFMAIACHDAEGGQGRFGAVNTIQFLIDRADRNASYHEMWWYHEATDEFGVIRIVSAARAAHSVAPQSDKYLPDAWLKTALGKWWYDPNQAVYAVSIAGKVADVDRYAKNPRFLAHAHRRMLELRQELGLSNRAEHFRFNPLSRSDWGKTLMNALGGLVTPDELPTLTESTMDWVSTMTPTVPTRMTIRPETSIRLAPDLTEASKPWTVGKQTTVTVVGKVNGVDFGSGPLWYVYILNAGGLRVFHSQDVVSAEAMAVGVTDPDDAEEDALIASLMAQVTGLNSRSRL